MIWDSVGDIRLLVLSLNLVVSIHKLLEKLKNFLQFSSLLIDISDI